MPVIPCGVSRMRRPRSTSAFAPSAVVRSPVAARPPTSRAIDLRLDQHAARALRHRQLHKLLPSVKLIFVTMHADPAYVSEAFKAGASAYLLKRSAARELDHAIEAVLKGQYYVTSLLTRELVTSLTQDSANLFAQRQELTPRQREVLQLVAEGRTIKETAALLNISPKTVEFHKSHLMSQLNLHTTAELTKYALTHGLIST